jgi:hypothetical protein
MDKMEYAELAAADLERLHKRRAESWSLEEFDKLPAGLAEPLTAESMRSLAFVCLSSESRVLRK